MGGHAARGADGEIVHAHEFAHEGADGLSLGRELQPVVESAALVGFEVTPGDVPEVRRIHELLNRFPQGGEHRLESGVEEERFLVAHEEMIDLHVKVGNVNGEPEEIGGDFSDGGHK